MFFQSVELKREDYSRESYYQYALRKTPGKWAALLTFCRDIPVGQFRYIECPDAMAPQIFRSRLRSMLSLNQRTMCLGFSIRLHGTFLTIFKTKEFGRLVLAKHHSIAALLRSTKTIQEIGQEVGCTRANIGALATKWGCPARGRATRPKLGSYGLTNHGSYCPQCKSVRLTKRGITKAARIKLKCGDCGRCFVQGQRAAWGSPAQRAHMLKIQAMMRGISRGPRPDMVAKWDDYRAGIGPRIIRHNPLAVYPYLNAHSSSEDEFMLKIVNEAVPKYILEEQRADLCQELIIGMLEGTIERTVQACKAGLKDIKGKWNRENRIGWREISLNSPAKGYDNKTFGEKLGIY